MGHSHQLSHHHTKEISHRWAHAKITSLHFKLSLRIQSIYLVHLIILPFTYQPHTLSTFPQTDLRSSIPVPCFWISQWFNQCGSEWCDLIVGIFIISTLNTNIRIYCDCGTYLSLWWCVLFCNNVYSCYVTLSSVFSLSLYIYIYIIHHFCKILASIAVVVLAQFNVSSFSALFLLWVSFNAHFLHVMILSNPSTIMLHTVVVIIYWHFIIQRYCCWNFINACTYSHFF